MLTPQQISETSFEKALFGGYDMDSVDDFLEPLTADYITLYKENSVLKSKMRILVEKLEEYRKNEASMQNAILAAQKTCDQMVADAERKCAQMLHEAEETASAKTVDTDALIGQEEQRLQAAQAAASRYIDAAEASLKKQLALLEELRAQTPAPAEAPQGVHQFTRPAETPFAPQSAPAKEHRAFDFDADQSHPSVEDKADALIDEIDQSIEAKMRGATRPPVGAALDPDATRRFESLPADKQKKFEDLKFGRNYDPKKR